MSRWRHERERWRCEQTRRREQAAATLPPDWIDANVWPTLPDDLQIALAGSSIDDEGYLCYDGHYEATITAHGEQINALVAQARRAAAVGSAR